MSADEIVRPSEQLLSASGNSRVVNALQISGSHNIVVAIAQTADGSVEPMLPWRGLPDVLPQALGIPNLLTWQLRLTPLVGRDNALRELHEWAAQKDTIRVRLLSGRGGTGKSRLAGEFAEQLRELGWTAGFLSLNALRDVAETSYVLGPSGILLIVDYPEEHRRESQQFLQRLAGLEVKSGKIRVLLVSRQPLEWWMRDIYAVHAESLLDDYELELGRLTENADIIRLFRSVGEVLSEKYKLGISSLSDQQILDWSQRDPEHNTTPLVLAAAAMQAVTEQLNTLEGSAGAIIKRLARRECARIENFGAQLGLPSGSAIKLIASATIAGRTDSSLTKRLCNSRIGLGWPDDQTVINLMRQMPSYQIDGLSAVAPDIVGAALLFEAILADPSRASEWLWLVLSHCVDDRVVSERLGRVAHDVRVVYGADSSSFIEWLITALGDDPGRAKALESLIREFKSPELITFALRASELILQTNDLNLNERIDVMRRYGSWTVQSGDSSKALPYCEESVLLARQLAKMEGTPDARDRLASCLHTLSFAFGRAREGRRALECIREAVEIRRDLIKEDAKYEERLASSLQNLSNYESEFAGDQQASLQAVNEAIAVYEKIWLHDAKKHDREYARAMQNLAARRWEDGDLNGSLVSLRTAVGRFQALYDADPSSNSDGLASSLMALSHRLSNSGDLKSSLDCAIRATDLRERLTATSPASFGSDFVDGLRVISDRHAELGSFRAALSVAEDALRQAEALVADNPTQFQIELAACRNTLANRLADVGEYSRAVLVSEEAVRLARVSKFTDPTRQQSVLAWSLRVFAQRLVAAGRFTESLPLILEATQIFEQRFVENTVRNGGEFIGSLLVESYCLHQCGYSLRAARRARYAVHVARELVAKGMPRFESDLAAALLELAYRYGDIGFNFLAISYANDAVRSFLALSKLWPVRYETRLRAAYQALSSRLSAAGDVVQALRASELAVDVIRPHVQAVPERFSAELADALSMLADRLFDFDRREDSQAMLEEAISIRKKLALEFPGRFGQPLALNFIKKAQVLREEEYDRALSCALEAIYDLRRLTDSTEAALNDCISYGLAVVSETRSAMGKREEALADIRESVEYARKAGEEVPGRYLEIVVSRLRTFSVRSASCNDHKNGVLAAEEALQLSRTLMKSIPARYTLLFATTAVACWRRQLASGASNPALLDQAFSLIRAGWRQEPMRYAAAFARAKRDYALARLAPKELSSQLSSAGESASAFAELSAESFEVFGAEFAQALVDFARFAKRNGRRKECEEFSKKAVRLAERIYLSQPRRGRELVVSANIELAQINREVGRLHTAIKCYSIAIRALEDAPDQEGVPLRLGNLWLDVAKLQNELNQSWAALESAKNAIPLLATDADEGGVLSVVDAKYQLARALKEEKELRAGILVLDEIIKDIARVAPQRINPRWLSLVWRTKSEIFESAGIAVDAANSLKQAIVSLELDRSTIDVKRRLAALYYDYSSLLAQCGMAEEAIEAVQQVFGLLGEIDSARLTPKDRDQLSASAERLSELTDVAFLGRMVRFRRTLLARMRSSYRRRKMFTRKRG